MVQVTLNLQWSYSKYMLLMLLMFIITTLFSCASILESSIIGGMSGLFAFGLDKLFTLPKRIIDKVSSTTKKENIL